MQGEPLYQVIRTKICDPWPNQVMAIESYHNEGVAQAIAEIWARLPAVKDGREKVRIVKHPAQTWTRPPNSGACTTDPAHISQLL